MDYFVLQKKVEAGSPPHLNGLLHESLIADGSNVPSDYPWYWVEQGQELQRLPQKLFFYTKDPQYQFDMRSGNMPGDFFISEVMLDALCLFLECKYQTASIELISNHKTIGKSKKYFYIRLDRSNFPSSSIIETVSSNVERRKTGEIKKILSLQFGSEVLPPVFMIREPSIARVIFFSEVVRQQCINFQPIGVEFLSSSAMGKLSRI